MNPNKSNMNKAILLRARVIRIITLVLMMTLMQTSLLAQNSKVSPLNIYQLDSYINSPKKNDASAARLKSLVYEVNPSIYYFNGTVKTFENNPTCLFTDISGFNAITKQDMLRNNVELITIRVENIQDFQSKINLENASNFPKLKFIYILATFDYDINSLPKSIVNQNDTYVVVFKSEKGA